MVKVSATPEPQLFALGVTSIVAVIGAVVVLVALKDKSPVPLAANPIAVFVLVQL